MNYLQQSQEKVVKEILLKRRIFPNIRKYLEIYGQLPTLGENNTVTFLPVELKRGENAFGEKVAENINGDNALGDNTDGANEAGLKIPGLWMNDGRIRAANATGDKIVGLSKFGDNIVATKASGLNIEESTTEGGKTVSKNVEVDTTDRPIALGGIILIVKAEGVVNMVCYFRRIFNEECYSSNLRG
ncbi:putative cation-transporting ATPase [Dirofilaria immitis]